MKKGFTLIELLAVIVVLAVVSMILIPLISGLIENSRKSALQDSAYGLVESANLFYFSNKEINNHIDFTCSKTGCVSSDSYSLKYKGNIENGNVRLYADGTVSLCIYTDKYYTLKNTSDTKVELGNGSCRYDEDTNKYVSSEALQLYIYLDTVKVKAFPTIGNYYVTVTCTNDKSASWNYTDWKLNLETSKSEVCNINFDTKKYTLANKTYTAGEEISWAGLSWYVLSNNSTSATIILKGNYQTGAYGTDTTWKNSTAYNKLNTEFVNSNTVVKDAITEQSVVYDGTSGSNIRLPYLNELGNLIPNSSNTLFWTMSANNSLLAFGKKDGTQGTSYTAGTYTTFYTAMMDGVSSCSSLYTLSCNTTYAGANYISPSSTSANDTLQTTINGNYYSSTCSYGYADGSYYHTCTPSGYKYDYFGAANGYYANQATGGCAKRTCYSVTGTTLGYRPVITILKAKI